MATQKTVIEVDIQGTQRVESMRSQIRKLREELARLPEGTEEFKKVQRRLGELKDKMDDLGKSVNTLSGDPLERLNNSFGMIGSSMLSLDFGQAQIGLKGVTSAIKDFKFGDLSKAAKGFGSTMLDLGKALLTNPIFLIGSIIALIVINFEKLTKAGGLVGKMFGFIKSVIDSVTQGLVDFMDWIGLTDSKADERAENEKKRAEEAKKLEDEKVKKQKEAEAEKEKLAKEAAKKEAERMQKVRDDQKSLNEFLKGEREKRFQESLSEQEKEIRQIDLAYEEKRRLAHNDKKLLKQLEDEHQKQVTDVNTKYATKRALDELEIAKKNNELLKQMRIESIAEEEALSQEIQNIRQGAQQTEIQAIQEEYFEKIELAKKLGLDYLALEEEQARKEGEVNDKYRKTEEEKEKALQDAKVQLASSALGSLIALNDAFPANSKKNALKSFKINKSLQLAQAAINGTQSVMAVLADPTLVGPTRYIAAASAGIAAAANIAKIQKTTFDSSKFDASTPSNNSGGGGGAPAVDLSFLNQGSNKSQPIQTYVLATNVSSAQEAEQKIKDQSKIIK